MEDKGKKKKAKPIHRFKPGNTMGKGRPKLHPDVMDIKPYTQRDLALIIRDMVDMEPEQILSLTQDPKTSCLKLMLASTIMKGVKEGDHSRIDFLFNRMIGKVKEVRELELKTVTYMTTVQANGVLLQEIIEDDLKQEAEKEVLNDFTGTEETAN